MAIKGYIDRDVPILADDMLNPYIRDFTLNLSYSLDEQDTGLTWIDGKKIYQRTVRIDLENVGACAVEVKDFDPETLVSASMVAGIKPDGTVDKSYFSDVRHIYVGYNTVGLSKVSNVALSALYTYVTIRYTKKGEQPVPPGPGPGPQPVDVKKWTKIENNRITLSDDFYLDMSVDPLPDLYYAFAKVGDQVRVVFMEPNIAWGSFNYKYITVGREYPQTARANETGSWRWAYNGGSCNIIEFVENLSDSYYIYNSVNDAFDDFKF